MESKLHAWLYGLLYPAFLGSVFVVAFTNGLPSWKEPEDQWFWALAVYFLLQFGEGVESRQTYTYTEAFGDFLELIAMGVGFFYLGALAVGASGDWNADARSAIAFALLIPPVKRVALWLLAPSGSPRRPVSVLSFLSFVAFVFVLLPDPLGLGGFGLLLIAYFVVLVRRARDQKKTFDKGQADPPLAEAPSGEATPATDSPAPSPETQPG